MSNYIDIDRLSSNMKTLRLSCGITQEELCNDLYLTRTTYSNFENGIKIPDLRTLDSLSSYYNVSFNSIFESDLSTELMRNVYFGFPTEPVKNVITNYESLSFASKRVVMEKLSTLLERENIFYKDYFPKIR